MREAPENVLFDGLFPLLFVVSTNFLLIPEEFKSCLQRNFRYIGDCAKCLTNKPADSVSFLSIAAAVTQTGYQFFNSIE